jgi:hypothetical protein
MRLFLVVMLLAGCSEEDSGTGGTEGGTEGGGVAGGDGEGGGAGEEGGGAAPALEPLEWDRHEVISASVTGAQIRMVTDPAGRPAIAFLRPNGEEVECELTNDEPFFRVVRREYDIVWSQRSPDGTWREEKIAQTDVVHGMGLAFDGDGSAYLAYLGGEPGTQWCAGSDLMLAKRTGDSWSGETTIQADSATGATCKKMQNVCNVGNVTGLWATLAISDDGDRVAVAFQDIHFGFSKEDWESADLEIALGPGGWAIDTVHDSEGAGKWTAAAFNADGKVSLAWYNNKSGGVWFAVEDTGGAEGDQGWPDDAVKISSADPSYPIQLAALPGGGYAVVYNDTREDQRGLYYSESKDGSVWLETPIEIGLNTGRSASMVLDQWGRPWVAYGACNDANTVRCDPQKDGVRLARWTGRRWDLTDVKGAVDSEASEGAVISLTLDSDGDPWVAFSRERFDAGTQETHAELRIVRAR